MQKQSESERLLAITEYEKEYWNLGILPAGMDEVGRGPLAGPVVVGCVILPAQPLIEYINDSKKVSEKRRELLYPRIKELAVACATGWIDEKTIDEINILNAIKLACKQAFYGMKHECRHVLIDALSGLDIAAEQIAIIHGDAKSYLIAAASIFAKVERDRYMIKMHEVYPQYGFDKNKGYGTAQHIAALREYGPCPLHRRSFIGNFIGEA
ncbi:MAG: ribonuclease HII [Clostridia bacterium]